MAFLPLRWSCMSTCGAGWINAAYIEGNGGGRAGGGAEPRLTRAPLGESRATHLDTVRAEESEIHRARRELVANGDGHASARPPGQGAAHAAALEGGERRQHRHHHGGCNFKARTREKQRRCSKQAALWKIESDGLRRAAALVEPTVGYRDSSWSAHSHPSRPPPAQDCSELRRQMHPPPPLCPPSPSQLDQMK